MFRLARFLALETGSKPTKIKKSPRHPTMQRVFSADGLFSAEKIDISPLKHPVSRDARTPVCILIVTGVAKANTLKYIWKKESAALRRASHVAL